MNYKISPIILVVIVFAFISCTPSPKKIADQKEQEVIDLHNVAMDKMTKKCRKTLQELKDERDEFMLDSASHHFAHLEECNYAIKDLELAEEAMMEWMRKYAELSKQTRTDEERIKFYDEEYLKIKAIDEQLTKSIKESLHFFHNWLIDKAEKQKKMHEEEKDENDSKDDNMEKTDSTSNADVQV